MTEDEKWQNMMSSCRKACKILGEEFQEPGYRNWIEGRSYHEALWRKVKAQGNPRIKHRGADAEAMAIGESLGLSFDGMQEKDYQFTVQEGPEGAAGITFYVKELTEVEGRLKEKFEEFNVGSQAEPEEIKLSGHMMEVPLGDKFPLQSESLRRLGDYKIIQEHDDGDLTIEVGKKQYLVSTSGEVFVRSGNPNNPVDLSKIRGEIIRLETDLEGKRAYLSEAYRESVEGAIDQMKICNLRGALDQSEMALMIGGMLGREPGIAGRIDTIENQLKDLMVEIAIEACDCKSRGG